MPCTEWRSAPQRSGGTTFAPPSIAIALRSTTSLACERRPHSATNGRLPIESTKHCCTAVLYLATTCGEPRMKVSRWQVIRRTTLPNHSWAWDLRDGRPKHEQRAREAGATGTRATRTGAHRTGAHRNGEKGAREGHPAAARSPPREARRAVGRPVMQSTAREERS